MQHIDPWYAQSHPDEDFAETFAVWLTPESNWQRRYAGWPALAKLEYVDTLMTQLRGKKALVESDEEVDPLRKLRHTLRRYYRRKRSHHGIDHPKFYDRELRKLFSDAPEHAGNMTAAQFLGKIRREVRRVVADWTGHLSVHDRSGPRGHDHALPRAEAAPRDTGRTGALRVHGAAHGADDELSP